ncbi:MAG TPA: hypothetical protein VF469_03680, partial [Kofleriaceae bacterium]
MNELVISASMEIGVMLEAVTSDIAEHFYSLHGPSPQCAGPPKTARCSRRQMLNFRAPADLPCDIRDPVGATLLRG